MKLSTQAVNWFSVCFTPDGFHLRRRKLSNTNGSLIYIPAIQDNLPY